MPVYYFKHQAKFAKWYRGYIRYPQKRIVVMR